MTTVGTVPACALRSRTSFAWRWRWYCTSCSCPQYTGINFLDLSFCMSSLATLNPCRDKLEHPVVLRLCVCAVEILITQGPAYEKNLAAKRLESRRMLMAFIRVAAMAYHLGGEISFEWPRYASGWSLPELIALIVQFGLIDALCDGCAFGLVNRAGLPLPEPWRTVTSSKRLAANLSAYRCRHERGFRHAPVKGSESRRSAFYPESMARTIEAPLFPYVQAFTAPALPCRPFMLHLTA